MKILRSIVKKRFFSASALALFFVCGLTYRAYCGSINAFITEIDAGQSSTGDGDAVELYVSSNSADIGGVTLVASGGGTITFPAVAVSSGDYIIAHFLSGTNSAAATVNSFGNRQWDFYLGAAGSLTNTDNTLTLKNSDNTTVDFVSYAKVDGSYSPTAGYDAAVAAVQWTPAAATPAEYEDGSVNNTTAMSTTKTLNRAVSSAFPVDTNTKADFSLSARSLGTIGGGTGGGGAGSISGLITEVAPSDTADWIEIYVTADCDVSGAQLYEKSTLVATLPAITAKKGEFIVIRSKSTATSESGASLSVGDTNRNGYWDVYTTYSGLTGTDSVLSLRKGDGSYVDAVPYSNRDGTTFSPKTDYNNLVESGQWTPASTVDWGSADYENNSANWKGGGSGKSVARKKTIDNEPQDGNIESDWELKTRQTPGYGYGGETLVTDKILEVKDPNPFSPHTGQEANLSYSVPRETIKTLKLYDVRGREVRRLIDQDRNLVEGGMLTAVGTGFIAWNGKSEAGAILPVGMYIAVLEAYDSTTKVTQKGAATVVIGRQF